MPPARLLADRLDCDKAGQAEPTHTDIATEGSLSAATAELDQPLDKSVNQPPMCLPACLDVGGFNRSLSRQIRRELRQTSPHLGRKGFQVWKTHRRDAFVHVTWNIIESGSNWPSLVLPGRDLC